MSVGSFVERISSVHLENCFNPYAQRCEVYDVYDAPEIRRDNLHKILTSLLGSDCVDVWVGRDLGYKGGRRTGLALTDEHSLVLYADHLSVSSLPRATTGPAVKEQTASNIYKVLTASDVPVLTWNVFPLHPHLPNQPFSNRKHSTKEALIGFTFLQEILSLFSVRNIVGIGSDAAGWLQQIRPDYIHVRHPSYGGQRDFLTQMAGIYDSPCENDPQLSFL